MKKKKKARQRRLFVVGLLVVLLIGGVSTVLLLFGKQDPSRTDYRSEGTSKQEGPKVKIVDLDSNERPYGVMIDNISYARPHSGLQQAYLTYEIIVEGGLTRLFALFKDVDVEKIGPVRSSRHYFLDYAMENDAIYVHYGWSPYAQEDIGTYKINNLNGLYNPSNMFWRATDRSAPHNAYTSTANILKAAKNKGYAMTSDKYLVLNYSARELDYSSDSTKVIAEKIDIAYSNLVTTSYTYDKEKKTYLRSINGKAHTDNETKQQYTVKNIIVITDIYNETIGAKGRQGIENIGKGNGKYITEGYAIDITWEKKDRKSKTIYRTKDGKELKVNDGNTYIQIQPKGQKLTIQ